MTLSQLSLVYMVAFLTSFVSDYIYYNLFSHQVFYDLVKEFKLFCPIYRI
jgi:hypothetical protein